MKKYLYVVILVAYLPSLFFALDVDTIFVWDNDRGKSDQRRPAVGVVGDNNGFAVWDDARWGDYDVFGQEYDDKALGLVGSNFPVSRDEYNQLHQFNCDLTCNPKNVFIAVWEESLYTPDQKPSRVFACIKGKEPYVVYEHERSQKLPSISSRRDGWFAISWTSYRGEPEPTIFCRIYDEQGQLKKENMVCEYVKITSYIPLSGVAFCDTGGLVVYEDYEGGTEISIYGQYFDRNGGVIKDRFKISYYSGGSEKNEKAPAVATNEYGDMVVVWVDDQYGTTQIWAQKMKAHEDGFDFIDDPFQVCPDGGAQRTPRVAMFDNGDFIVTWEENRSGEIDVWGRVWISKAGRDPFRIPVNNTSRQLQAYPTARWTDFLSVVWTSWAYHIKYPDVFLRNFRWNNESNTGVSALSGDIPLVAIDPDTNVGGRKCWYHDDENYDNPSTPWNEDPINEPDSVYVDLDVAIVDQIMELNTNGQYFVLCEDTLPVRDQGDALSDYDALFLDFGYRTALSTAGEITALECAEVADYIESYNKPVMLDGNDFGYMYDTTYLYTLFRAEFRGDGAANTTGNIDTLYGTAYAKDLMVGYPYQGLPDNYPDSIRPINGSRLIMQTKDLDDWYAGYSVGFSMAWKKGERATGSTVYNSFVPSAITTTTHPNTYAEYYRRCLGHLGLAVQPEPIVDLTTDTVGLGEGEIELNWTIVFDDSIQDPVNDGYQLKFSRTKMTSESAYDAAEEYYQNWETPGNNDDPASEVCYGLPPLDTLIFALKCHDESDLYNALGAEPKMVVPGDSISPHSITVGDNYVKDFSNAYELIDVSDNYSYDSLFVTWDASNIYFGFARRSFQSTADMLIYIDVASGGADSTYRQSLTGAKSPFIAQTGVFKPDYCFALEHSTSYRLWQGTSSKGRADSWTSVTFNGVISNDNVVNGYRYTEIRLPFSDIGYSPANPFKLIVTIQDESSNTIRDIFPIYNPSGVAGVIITQYYYWARLASGIVPNRGVSVIGIEEEQSMPEPKMFGKTLLAVPNPFRSTIDLYLNMDCIVSCEHAALRIHDVTGRMVRDFDLSRWGNSQAPKITWDGKDDRGIQVARGVYFCELVADDRSVMEKIIYIR